MSTARQDYLKQFSRLVRWRLPRSEAKEILADYEEMLSRRPAEDDAKLIQDLGAPAQAARLLTDRGAYLRWLTVFCLMALCLLLPEIMLLRASFTRQSAALMVMLLLLGMGVSLFWFRPRHGTEKGSLPRGLLTALAGVLAVVAAAGAALGGLASGIWQSWPPALYGTAARWTLWIAGTAAAMAGMLGLIKARMSDRRWRALYVLGSAALVECALVLALLTSMDLSGSAQDWWVPSAVRWGAVGIVGLTGTGASLC